MEFPQLYIVLLPFSMLHHLINRSCDIGMPVAGFEQDDGDDVPLREVHIFVNDACDYSVMYLPKWYKPPINIISFAPSRSCSLQARMDARSWRPGHELQHQLMSAL